MAIPGPIPHRGILASSTQVTPSDQKNAQFQALELISLETTLASKRDRNSSTQFGNALQQIQEKFFNPELNKLRIDQMKWPDPPDVILDIFNPSKGCVELGLVETLIKFCGDQQYLLTPQGEESEDEARDRAIRNLDSTLQKLSKTYQFGGDKDVLLAFLNLEKPRNKDNFMGLLSNAIFDWRKEGIPGQTNVTRGFLDLINNTTLEHDFYYFNSDSAPPEVGDITTFNYGGKSGLAAWNEMACDKVLSFHATPDIVGSYQEVSEAVFEKIKKKLDPKGEKYTFFFNPDSNLLNIFPKSFNAQQLKTGTAQNKFQTFSYSPNDSTPPILLTNTHLGSLSPNVPFEKLNQKLTTEGHELKKEAVSYDTWILPGDHNLIGAWDDKSSFDIPEDFKAELYTFRSLAGKSPTDSCKATGTEISLIAFCRFIKEAMGQDVRVEFILSPDSEKKYPDLLGTAQFRKACQTKSGESVFIVRATKLLQGDGFQLAILENSNHGPKPLHLKTENGGDINISESNPSDHYPVIHNGIAAHNLMMTPDCSRFNKFPFDRSDYIQYFLEIIQNCIKSI